MEYCGNRAAGEQQQQQQQQQRRFTITDLKHQAAEYYRSNEVPQRLEEVLNAMFYQRPEDFYGHLANYFSELSKPPVITRLVGKKVLDGIGRPTLEVEVSCRVRNCVKRICSSMISSHAEILENASPEAIDADEREREESIKIAIEWINESLNEMFTGLQPTDQHKADELLGEYFAKKAEADEERREAEKEKEKENQEAEASGASAAPAPSGKKKPNKAAKKLSVLEKPIPPAEPAEPVVMGSMAIGCTSLAFAKTAATLRDMPLYLHIALLKHDQGVERCVDIQREVMKLLSQTTNMPSSVGEGKKTSRDAAKKAPSPVLKKMSHLGCLVTGFESLEQPLALIQSACTHLSLELGIDVYLGINCAAHELIDCSKGKYEVILGTFKSPDEMVDVYVDLIRKFPSIMTLIDPLRKEDCQQWITLRNTLGSKCYIFAEELCKSVSKLMENHNTPKCSGLVLKYTNEAKISDLCKITQLLDGRKRISILGSPDGETSDDSLVDLAVGLRTRFIKLGGLSRGERVAKYNRLLAIEEELGKNGRLGEREDHEFVDYTEEEEEEEEEELESTYITARTERSAT
ncbi:enolase 4 isoform X2 [Podarcis raffonei]|uniref:enolase 4 isoform X2 n=1 Tax=Podarcis raffonei TaxID=65483 RepID=UPI002329734C|nr:enolase 4 isoform X2 [Podarcis raffonei]